MAENELPKIPNKKIVPPPKTELTGINPQDKMNFKFKFLGRTARMLDLFDLNIRKGVDGKQRIEPIHPAAGSPGKRVPDEVLKVTLSDQHFVPAVAKVMETWIAQLIDLGTSWEDWKELVADLRTLFYSSPQAAKSVIMSRDEAVQADVNTSILGVESPSKKQRDHILSFIKRTNIEKKIKDLMFNILMYGDAGWVLSLGKDGVEAVTPLDVLSLERVLEFTAADVKDGKDPAFDYMKKAPKIQDLIDAIEKQKDLSWMFKTYTLGYVIKGILVAPWQFIHFRNFSTDSPFKPRGMPPFLHMLAPFRQREMAMSLQMAARAARFPIGRYKLKFPNTFEPTEKLEEAVRFQNKLDNSGLYAVRKETSGIGGRIICIDELFEYDEIVSNIDLGRIDDIELLKDDERDSSFLPKAAFYPDGGGLGTSGKALVQEFKPFGRFVFNIQSVALEGLTKLFTIDMILSNKFSADELDFNITMPYPESQTDREQIGAQTDLVTLVGALCDMLAKRILGDEAAALPKDLIKQILLQILPYDDERIEDWVKLIMSTRPETDETEVQESYKKIKEAYSGKDPETKRNRSYLLREDIQEAKFKVMNKLSEGRIKDRHFASNSVMDEDFDCKFLFDVKKKSGIKLNEKYDEPTLYAQYKLDEGTEIFPSHMRKKEEDIDKELQKDHFGNIIKSVDDIIPKDPFAEEVK